MSSTLSETCRPTARRRLDLDGDTLREECGVFGIYGPPGRGRRSRRSGSTPSSIAGRRRPASSPSTAACSISSASSGLVGDSFSDRATIERLRASSIGHVRYSTTGETVLRNVQPLFAELDGRRLRGRP
jgi:amidophosphoribosyltransferase